MLVKQANSFRSIDDLLQNQKDPSMLNQLFDKKKKLLALVDSGQLTAQKYLTICKKVMTESTNQQIKDSVEMEMISAQDDVKGWFKDILQQTRQKLEDQNKKFSKLGSGSQTATQNKPALQPQQQKRVEQVSRQQKKAPSNIPPTKLQQKPSTNSSGPLDPSKIFSLKVLDNLMEENGGNKQYYMSLYEHKEKILQLIKQKKLNAQMYLQAIQKLQKSANNQDISFTVQMQIDQLKQFHEGKVQQWFRDRLQSSQEQKEKQQQKYSMLKTGKAIPKNSKRQSQEFNEVDSLTSDIKNKMKNAKISSSNSILFSFRYLDQEMQKNQSNTKLFCQLFEQKLKFLQLIKNGEVDAQGYRDILAQIIQESQNEQLKAAAQMEVDLHDITGDVMQFFQSAIQQTGQKFEQQEKTYNKITGGKGQKLNINNSTNNTNTNLPKKPQQSIVIQQEVKPDISDIVSFHVLTQYLQKYKKDYDYCFELKEKGSKLLKLVQDKKLGPNEYIRFLEKKIESCKDKQTLTLMKIQLKKFQQTNNASKLFKQTLGEYVNKVKVNLGHRTSYDSKIEINEYTINEAEPKLKIQYLLRKLGKYQSLLAYYKNNKLQRHLKQFQQEYRSKKKNTLQLCQRIKNGDGNSLDIHQYADKNLPNVTFSVLHRQSKTSYNEKLSQVIEKIKKSNVKIGQYVKTLKKGTNKNNIQEGAKMIEKNNGTIAYLQKLKNQELIPFPLVQQIKTEMYNLDLNKKLTQNQIQIIVTHVDGVRDSLILRIFMIDRKHPRFEAHIANGPQSKIDVIMKIPPQIMEQIIRGTQKRYLSFGLYSKGWFSQNLVAQADLQLNFIRSNRMQEKLQLKQGKINLDLVINVQKPKKPIVTDILTIKLTQYPRYQHNSFIQNQFIKTIMPFEKPTQSQIKS